MADIQYLFTGISSKQPKSMDELTDELRKLELLEYKRRTDPMALASIDRRRKKVLAWIDQEGTRLDREINRISASVDSPYDFNKFAEAEDYEFESEEGESEEHEESESLGEEEEEHEEGHEEYDYDEDQEIELMQAALTTSGATRDILEKLLGMYKSAPESTNEKVDEIFEDRDFVPDMGSGIDLRSPSDEDRLASFTAAILRKRAAYQDFFGGEDFTPTGEDPELFEQDHEDRRKSFRPELDDERDNELLRQVLGPDDPARAAEARLRELGLWPEDPEGPEEMPDVVDTGNRYNYFASKKSKFTKISERDPLAEQAMSDALRDMKEDGHELPADFWEEVDLSDLPGLRHHNAPRKRVLGPRLEGDSGGGMSLGTSIDLTDEEIVELVRDSQEKRRREIEVDQNNRTRERGMLDSRQERRKLTEMPPSPDASGFLARLTEQYPKRGTELKDTLEASSVNRLVKKAQMGDPKYNEISHLSDMELVDIARKIQEAFGPNSTIYETKEPEEIAHEMREGFKSVQEYIQHCKYMEDIFADRMGIGIQDNEKHQAFLGEQGEMENNWNHRLDDLMANAKKRSIKKAQMGEQGDERGLASNLKTKKTAINNYFGNYKVEF